MLEIGSLFPRQLNVSTQEESLKSNTRYYKVHAINLILPDFITNLENAQIQHTVQWESLVWWG